MPSILYKISPIFTDFMKYFANFYKFSWNSLRFFENFTVSSIFPNIFSEIREIYENSQKF
jgi:hypothetical protein